MTENEQIFLDKMNRKMDSRADANWQSIADVDWGDLEHFLDNARRLKDAESFNTAIRVLEALKEQVLGKA